MCKTCKTAEGFAHLGQNDTALGVIEEEIKRGKDPEHFKRLLDKILGTQEPETDPERDAAWERSHR